MERPLDQETANADLISDILSPTPGLSSPVSDLARDLTSGSSAWREAWAVGPANPELVDGLAASSKRLSYDEDEELRRLNYLAEIGTLAGVKAERLVELRLRDRREEVRPPREVAEENIDPETKRKWYQFHSQ